MPIIAFMMPIAGFGPTIRSALRGRRASIQIGIDLPADTAATLVNPAAYADHRLHDAYRWLRANNPLGVARAEGFDPDRNRSSGRHGRDAGESGGLCRSSPS